MFETIKKKAKEAKDWVVNNKESILIGCYGSACVILGAVVMNSTNKKNAKSRDIVDNYVNDYMNNNDDLLSQVLRVENKSTGGYWGYGEDGVTIGNLSERIIKDGENAEKKVIGALVYTQNE